ncbi:MAG: T9SS type A sorting domain-containing protein, partial [Flavobacteriaceae bacterium]|nr:T9SS type A sorting domain-containing protein [Flavobacteriaceae bacterium]
IFVSLSLNAATINVSSIADLQNACDNSNPGDIIILANGTYQDVTLDLNNNNITIMAQTPGSVFLNGYDDINIWSNDVTFTGFQFTSGDIGSNYLIEVYGNRNKLTHLNFSNYSAKKYIEIKAGSQYNEISFCNLEKKPASAVTGCTIQISTSTTVIGYHKISYCSFQNYYGAGSDYGNEPVRIGLSSEYLNKSRTIVEHCYFNNTGLGDAETISIKCQENVVRYCTFTNQQNAMLSFRNGDNNVAYSNFFINAGGIRVKEANNIYCYNNYFENSGVGSTADAIAYVYVAPLVPPTTASPRTLNLSNINFIHNTFYNCGDMDLGGNGPTNNSWANNIFRKASGNLFSNANNGITWAGNIYQGTIGITIPSGMTNSNPFLALNADGYYGLTASSPVNNANASYPAILDIVNIDDDPSLLFDIAGRPRPTSVTLKDVGCEEYTTGTTTNHPLTLSEVGPSYLAVLSSETFDLLYQKTFVFPNPAKNNFTIQFPNTIDSDLEVSIITINGQIVKKQIISQNELIDYQKKVDVTDLKNGIYLIQLYSTNYSKTLKIVIQK